jgi:hypothetical protein
MVDERLEKLGLYFTHFAVQERFNITFEQFVGMVNEGRWQDVMLSNEDILRRANKNEFYRTRIEIRTI